MRYRTIALLLPLTFTAGLACGGDDENNATTGGATSEAASTTSSVGTSTGSGGAGGGTGGNGGDASGPPSAEDLLALVRSCTVVSNGNYKTDDEDGLPEDIPICGLTGAVFWNADMDIDCDGKTSAACNLGTDPAYLPETSATDSNGEPLDAASLPFVVVPLPSSRFDYSEAGLALGSVIAVVYANQVVYGVFGDEGPTEIIGEASYAMASLLGIDPDPSFGGVDSGVTYIAFTGAGAVVETIEDTAEATALGEVLGAKLVDEN